ncbi:uncharacterized protein LOC118485125 [Helianthus annuus]|uniref:uncharacterized protein LOC118485125 n=1 Tax=Helianthus annuus TaxID=4232 RepID=UPI001652EA96|nr:uncharacterized protein LOC118485125 [Helianthus annuus]
MALLFQSLPDDILLQVAKYNRAHEVWEAIRVRFLGADRVQKARLHVLRSELENLKMKDNELIDEFAGRISAIEGRFNNLVSVIEPETLVRKLFNSLPIRFLPIIASIEQSEDLETMPFEEAIGRLKAFEDRVRLYAGNEGETYGRLLFSKSENQPRQSRFENKKSQGRGRYGNGSDTRGRGRGRGRGNGRGQGRGNSSNGNRNYNNQGRDKSTVRCYNCNELGHFAWECP